MGLNEARARIRARVWQNLAKSGLDLDQYSEEDLEELIAIATDAALLEMDEEIGESLAKEPSDATKLADHDGEQVLWEGRPFLSITTQYIITNERLRIIEGLLGKSRIDIELVRIQDMDQSQSVSDRLLSIGDISVSSHDPNDPAVVLRNVSDPEQVHEILRRAVLNARGRSGLTFQEEM